MTEYNKLVRDKIPEIIRAGGETPRYTIIENDGQFLEALLKKDTEESAELARDLNLEELADKLEVLYAIGIALGYTPAEVESARIHKRDERGGFERRVFLESTD